MSKSFDFQAFSLFTRNGQRKYLNSQERHEFYDCTRELALPKKLFCRMVYFTGARLSEIADMKVAQIDFIDKTLIVRTLKQRRDDVYRQIPLPSHLLSDCLHLIDIRRKLRGIYNLDNEPMWPFCARTGARTIKSVMEKACIDNIRASAMGLRHGFAVHAVSKAPLTQVQKWMGHAYLETTSIYLQVCGHEERQWAEKLWDEED